MYYKSPKDLAKKADSDPVDRRWGSRICASNKPPLGGGAAAPGQMCDITGVLAPCGRE